MKSSWIFIIYMLWLNGHQCAPTKQEEMNLRENLKQLSEVGEKYVDEEVKKALIGIKQMKIMMERNEDKHIDLMKTLKKSSEEKQQALRLMDEVKARLEEEERQCQVALKNLWDECESCLESTCMRYYTTCKRGVSTFKRKPFRYHSQIPQMYLLDFQEVVDAESIAVKVIYHLVTVFDPLGNFLSELYALFEAFKFAEGRKDLPIGESGQAFYKSWQEQSPSVPYTAHKYTEMHLASFQDKVQIVCWKKSECRYFEPPQIKGQLVEDFLRKIPPLIFTFHEDQGKDIQFNEKSEKEDTQLVKMEDLFSQLLSDVGSIFDRSFIFFKHMQKEFDQSFQTYFMSDLDLNESPSMAALPEDTTRNDSSQKGWAMPGFLQIVFDFSRTVFEGVSEVITDVFDEYRDYRRDLPEQTKDPDRSGMFSKIVPGHQRPQCRELRENSSGCPQFHERCQKCQDNLLHDCPNVPELHIKFDEAFKLVNLSGEQYEQILQVVRHHTEDTSYLLTKMKERFGWVSELSNMTIGPESIFNIVKVVPGDPSSKNETVVDVNILTSPTFTIKVPPNLDPESAEFIEYVAGKALQLYKQNF